MTLTIITVLEIIGFGIYVGGVVSLLANRTSMTKQYILQSTFVFALSLINYLLWYSVLK